MATATALVAEANEEDELSLDQQFVSFSLGNENFAFPMSLVREIVRLPQIVSVPLTPASLLGLANLRGNILPLVDLRRLLGLEPREPDVSTRVVVIDNGQIMGLMVDRIDRVFIPERDQIEDATEIQSSIDSKLLSGVIKSDDEEGLIQLLSLETLIADNFKAIAGMSAANTTQGLTQTTQKHSETEEEDLLQLVSFLVAKQEFSFEISTVQEIVRLPEHISMVPRSAPHILGMIELRGRLLPLLSLRRLFQLEDAPTNVHNRILVIGANGKGAVGVVVDQVREVLHVPQEVQDSTPDLLRQGGELNEIDSICRLEQGQRLVSVINSQALFEDPAVQAAVAAKELEEGAMDTEEEVLDEEDEDITQMVVFGLGKQEYGVLIEAVQEITRVPANLIKVPRTPDFIEGMINLRGTVLPVVDMRSRFGLPRNERSEQQRILVLDLNGTRTGFITDAVSEVLHLHREAIEAAPSLSDDQVRILGKVANLQDDKRMIQILDVDELLDQAQQKQLQDVDAGS